MKKGLIIGAVMMITALALYTTAYAGAWLKDNTGWWWRNDDGSYPANSWQWIDGNNDGIAECYYFDGRGYLLTDTITPDGYTVNADGAWVAGGVVQTKAVAAAGTTAAEAVPETSPAEPETSPSSPAYVENSYNPFGDNMPTMGEHKPSYEDIEDDDEIGYVPIYP